jgi:hypothetical protein
MVPTDTTYHASMILNRTLSLPALLVYYYQLYNKYILLVHMFWWVPVSSTGKVSYGRARDLGSNPVYTKNQLVSWLDGKSNHHEQTP